MGPNDRRKHPRFPLLLRVVWQGAEEWTENVSEAGLFVRTTRELDRGQAVTMRVSFPGLLSAFDFGGACAWKRRGNAWLASGVGLHIEKGRDRLAAIAAACDAKAAPRLEPFPVLALRPPPTALPPRAPVSVTEAATADAAVAALDMPPRLIIASLYAPTTECLRAIRELKSRSRAPIVALSNGDADEDARAVGAGVTAVVPRGVRLEQLYDTVAVLSRL